MKKCIFFLAGYDYLSLPIYLELSKKITEYDIFYLNTEEFGKVNQKTRDKELIVSLYENIEKNILPNKAKSNLKNFKRNLKELVNKYEPIAIMSTSDLSVSYHALKLVTNISMTWILIQPSFFQFGQPEFPFKNKLKNLINYYLRKRPIRRFQNNWGMEYLEDFKLVWGDYFNEKIKAKRVFSVGNFRLEEYFRNRRNVMSISNVVYFTAPLELILDSKKMKALNDTLSQIVSQNPDINFTIKVHPREELRPYKSQFQQGQNVQVIQNQSLLDIYKKNDLHLSVMSSTCMEAMAMNLPVAFIKIFDSALTKPIDKDAYSEIKNPADFKELITHWEKKMSVTNRYLSSNGLEKIKSILKNGANL